jgi:hypothetical protein
VKIIGQCVEAGLVDGKKLHMDGSYVNANASRESIRSGPPELIEALRGTFRREEAKLDDNQDRTGRRGEENSESNRSRRQPGT